jgi:hypothetical protein
VAYYKPPVHLKAAPLIFRNIARHAKDVRVVLPGNPLCQGLGNPRSRNVADNSRRHHSLKNSLWQNGIDGVSFLIYVLLTQLIINLKLPMMKAEYLNH